MIKCEVLVDRCSLVVGKGSIVLVDERQFEVARNFIKPVEIKEVKKVEATQEVVEEITKKTTKKK